MLDSLLVPVDGSAPALRAARLAAQLAGPRGTLTFLHAIEPADIVPLVGIEDAASAASLGPLIEERRLEADTLSRRVLEEARTAANRPDAALEVVTARAPDAVLDLLPKHDACVIGSRGRGLIARTLLGSVSDSVLRHADRSVVVARRDHVTRILLATDGSAHAGRAAAAAGELARRLAVPVSMVSVAEFPIDTYLAQRAQVEAVFRDAAAQAFAAARAAGGFDAAVPGELVFHEPVHAILAHAERTGADLVVVGRRGRGASPRALLGSVSHRVALNADVSVLVVP